MSIVRCQSMNQLSGWLEQIEREHKETRAVGLDRVLDVATRLDVVNPAAKCVVIAGTNGKGSTVHYLERLLIEAGHSVGATASPHLKHYNERIRLNGRPVDDKAIVFAFEEIQSEAGSTPLTYFEWATLAGLVVFRLHEVECALLEVGLGGRLDAANVVRRDVTVITNVGLDHMNLLGHDRESIGSEKAGILCSGIPLVYGDRCPVHSVTTKASALQCPTYLAGSDYSHWVNDDSTWSTSVSCDNTICSNRFLSVPSMREAALMALQATLLLVPDLKADRHQEWLSTSLPGRMELVRHRERDWLLDAAHNPDAARYVRQRLNQDFPNRNVKLLFGCMRDKAGLEMLKMLEIPESHVIVTDTLGDRGIRATDLLEELGSSPAQVEPELSHAIDYLIESTDPHDLLLATGSFQLVSRVRDVIGFGIGSRR